MMLWVRPQLPVVVFLLLVCGSVGGEYKRVCYFANWAQYRPGIMRYVARNINPSLCTHIVYAFAKVLPDTNTIGPTENNDDGLGGNYKQVTYLKDSSPALKVMLAVGGANEASAGFTDVVSTDARIDTFCDNVIKYLRDRNFDGLDLDWEFPGQYGSPAGDRERFTKLVTRLREKFDTEAGTQSTKTKLILSAAVSGSYLNINSAYAVNSISSHLDFINIMAFDYQGSWSSGIDHACPLYSRTDQTPPQSYMNADYAVRYWINQGMPAPKIVLGIPLYGKSFELQSPSLYKFGDPFKNASEDLPYYKVCSESTSKPIYQYRYLWQVEQNASYAYDSRLWVGYETQKSIEIKANYIKDNNLGGAMVFEISQDDFNGQFCNQGNYPLLTKLKQVLLFSKDQCQAGTYVNSSIYSCTDCPLDTYQDKISQTQCINCPDNTQTKSTRSTGQYFCHAPCPAGQAFNTLKSICKACPINYFQDGQPSSRHCVKCPKDNHTLAQGSSKCIPVTDDTKPPPLDRMTYTLAMKFTTTSCDRPELLITSLQDEARKKMLLVNKEWEGICKQNCNNVNVGNDVKGCTNAKRRRRAVTPIEMNLIFTDIPQELKQTVTFGSGQTRSTQSILDDYFYDKTIFQSLSSTFGLTYENVVKSDITLVCVQPGYVLTSTMCEPCPVGTLQLLTECPSCINGFYQNKTGSTSCTKCPLYMTTNMKGATSVKQCFVQCPKGTRKDDGSCAKCPVGYYQDAIDQMGCIMCLPYYTTKEEGSTSFDDCFLQCPAGTKEKSDSCVKCAIGEYQKEMNAQSCNTCPQYKTTNATGATLIDQCFLQCPSGSKANAGTCEACPIGQYQDEVGSTSCKDCPDSKTTNIRGAHSSDFCVAAAVQCPKGTKDVSGKCVQCPLNYYQDETNQTSCKECGQYQITNNMGATSSDQCILQCPVGMKQVSGTCVLCPVNFYQDETNQTSCKSCRQYYITNNPGATSSNQCILQCPAGMKQVSGTCEFCPVNFYQDETNQTSCKSCQQYYITNNPGATSSSQCILQCPAGMKQVSGTCEFCPVNFYQDETNQTTCKSCQQYYITNNPGATLSSQCILQCPPGTKEVSGTCHECPVDSYQDETSQTTCKPCLNDRITSKPGATSSSQCTILRCPAGTKEISGTCVLCPVGQYQDQVGQTSCKTCPQAKVTNITGAKSVDQCLLKCPVGYMQIATVCVDCPVGQYQDEPGSPDCKVCPVYKTTKNSRTESLDGCILQCPAGTREMSGTCLKCPVGQYQDELSKSVCKNCPEYKTTSNTGAKSIGQCFLQCPVGTKEVSGTCSKCPIGQYQDELSKSTCKDCPQYKTTRVMGATSMSQCFLQCPAGMKEDSGTCVKCPQGQYQDGIGAASCKSCPQYKTTSEEGTTSIDKCFLQCPVGTKEVSGTCSNCTIGQYQDEVSKSTCKYCPQYKTTRVMGATSMSQCFLQCPVGTKEVSGTCSNCTIGQYQDEVSKSTCKDCPQYKTTRVMGATSMSQCFLQCPVGTKEVSGTCSNCTIGQYQDELSKSTCKDCPQYKTTRVMGATSMSQCFLQCPAGMKEDSGKCVKCPQGQYQDGIGAASCKSCPQYKTTSEDGTTSIDKCFLWCPTGTKGVMPDTCVKCPLGQYQDAAGSFSCKMCGKFKTTSSVGTTSPSLCLLQCPVGTKEESGTCSKCSIGQYQDELSKKTCKDCPQFQTTNVTGASSISQCFFWCPVGRKLESGTCVKCPVGQYQDVAGSSTCKSCAEFQTTNSEESTSTNQCFLYCPVGRKKESGTCVLCPIGQYQDETGKSVCKSCGVNKVTTQTGSTSQNQCILQCPAGTMETSGSCMQCPKGQYQDQIDSSMCKTCPTFKTTKVTGATSLDQCVWNCPQGMKEEGNACVLCPLGLYQDEVGWNTCKSCPVYRTTNTTGSKSLDDCTPMCLAGTMGARGVCVKCPKGQFQDEIGTTLCKACPMYRTTNATGTKSMDYCFLFCPVGMMESGGTCAECPAGQYQDETNSKSCKKCPEHSSSTSTGATSIEQCLVKCPAGYKEVAGLCVTCPTNYYQDVAGSSTCKHCPQYKYTQSTGSTTVTQCILSCPVGMKEESAQCVQCPVDQYQDETGKSTCKNCPNYRHTNLTGASSPEQCLTPCEMSPDFCQNGGTCLWSEAEPTAAKTCACRTRFTGAHCEKYTDSAESLTSVVGGAVGGSLAFLLILIAILIACACWRFSNKEKSHRTKSVDDISEGVYNPYFYMDGKYVVTQPATVVELVEPTETSTDHSIKRHSSRSIYTRATSQLETQEQKNAFMDMGNESEDPLYDNRTSDINEYKFGLPYVGLMNKGNDDENEAEDSADHGKSQRDVKYDNTSDGPLMNGGGIYVRKINI